MTTLVLSEPLKSFSLSFRPLEYNILTGAESEGNRGIHLYRMEDVTVDQRQMRLPLHLIDYFAGFPVTAYFKNLVQNRLQKGT